MKFETIIELSKELHQAKLNDELVWESTGNRREETNWNGQEIIIDRRNNIDRNTQEIYLKIGSYETAFLPDTKEFKYLGEYLEKI